MLGVTDPNRIFIIKDKYAEELRKQLKEMKSFNVINYDINAREFVPYDVIPYLVNTYNERVKRYYEINLKASTSKTQKEFDSYKDLLEYWRIPKTFDEFKDFVKKESQYQFWSRCEYEIILVDWPCQKDEEKWDVYDQIMMNLDTVTKLVMESI